MHSIRHEWASVVAFVHEASQRAGEKTIFILILLLNCYLLFASVAMLIPSETASFSFNDDGNDEYKNNNNSICLRICHETRSFLLCLARVLFCLISLFYYIGKCDIFRGKFIHQGG